MAIAEGAAAMCGVSPDVKEPLPTYLPWYCLTSTPPHLTGLEPSSLASQS